MSPDGIRVLVIDDDPAIRSLLELLLKRSHLAGDFAPDGQHGLNHLQSNRYAAIILDLMMPELDGFGLIDLLAETKPELCKRIIVLTAVSHTTLSRLDDERVWCVVRKPFDIDWLMQRVVECAAHHAETMTGQ